MSNFITPFILPSSYFTCLHKAINATANYFNYFTYFARISNISSASCHLLSTINSVTYTIYLPTYSIWHPCCNYLRVKRKWVKQSHLKQNKTATYLIFAERPLVIVIRCKVKVLNCVIYLPVERLYYTINNRYYVFLCNDNTRLRHCQFIRNY